MIAVQTKRAAILHQHLSGKKISEIFHSLTQTGIGRKLVERTVNRYIDIGSVEDRPRSGRPRSKRSPKFLKALKNRIRRNPRRTQRKMAIQMNVSSTTMSRALKVDLGLKALKRGKQHLLTARQVKNRLARSRALIKRYAGEKWKRIFFTDEKIFTVEAKYNKQNDRVYAQ